MDETMLQAIINLQNTQVKAILATIIRTEGSTPRHRGTQMLIKENGKSLGTIGGGTAESLIVKRALALLAVNSEIQGEIHRVGINQETGTSILSFCGANMDILLERVQETDIWQFAFNLQLSGKDAVMLTSLVPPYTKIILDSEDNVLWGSGQPNMMGISDEARWLIEPLLKTTRLLILGAGHVAREVAYYARPLDFQVTVIDDRATFALPEFFPGAHAVLCDDFATGIKNYQPNGDTFVIIATWSHKTDADCLQHVLNFSAKYVGMLGSTKKVSTIVKKLQDAGYTAQNLARLRAPVGINISAQTPSEIAISILAEIISVRRST
ncbi:MAG TPA: XdhC family protein [Desulfosporosinus sp.]